MDSKKIKFQAGQSPFFHSVSREVEKFIKDGNQLVQGKIILWLKASLYFLLHFISYLYLLLIHHSFLGLVVSYAFVGLSGILLAFNVAHDACHETFSKRKMVNKWLYHISFNLQGMSAYLWKIRHVSSHHLFPNVDGCDADIDNNPMIRLSPHHPIRSYQRYQHLYALLVYAVYSLHWFLVKDWLYLLKKQLANITNSGHPLKQWLLFVFWKSAYISLLIVWPILLGYSTADVLISFCVMHVLISWLFIHTLIITHLCMETQFPKPDEEGYLPVDYYLHQLITSLDFSPTNKILNWLLGGFNAHAAHHLFPRLPHTLYPEISAIIERNAKEFNIAYNQLSFPQAIRSHYLYLKKMGATLELEKTQR